MAPATIEEMKRPVNWQWLIGLLAAVLTPVTIGLISMGKNISSLEVGYQIQKEEIKELKTNQYINSVKMDQGFEKINGKLEQVLINMERKADRDK